MPCATSPPRLKPTLTSLPLALLSRIMLHLCEDDIHDIRGSLRGTTTFLPSRFPCTIQILDFADNAHATLPAGLLAPALSSPVLAAVAVYLLGARSSYLTFLNTEARLPLWIQAFSGYVQAVSAGIVAEKYHDDLPDNLRNFRLNKVCRDTTDMFKAITVNDVRLNVLDLVNVPFDQCASMKDDMMTGLCATLEAIHITLMELALPVYSKSDLCACALETVTLPNLTLLSIELMNLRDPENVSSRRKQRLARPFLRMMQAVDGHADRARGLTTLLELRLINLHVVPCATVKESGCSFGFFRAVRTLRAAMVRQVEGNEPVECASNEDLSFFSLFRKLECLSWNGMPDESHSAFAVLCKRLDEVHLCHKRWITGAKVGAKEFESIHWGHTNFVLNSVEMSFNKIKTLVTYDEVDAYGLLRIAECCPNLRYLSLYVTPRNVSELRGLIKKCERLAGLELIVAEYQLGELGSEGWLELGKVIPRNHANLAKVAIETQFRYSAIPGPEDAVIQCFVDVAKRLGLRAERLVLRAGLKSKRIVRLIHGLCRILDTCRYARYLRYLEVDIIAQRGWKAKVFALNDAKWELSVSYSLLQAFCRLLGKVDLGYMHRFLRES